MPFPLKCLRTVNSTFFCSTIPKQILKLKKRNRKAGHNTSMSNTETEWKLPPGDEVQLDHSPYNISDPHMEQQIFQHRAIILSFAVFVTIGNLLALIVVSRSNFRKSNVSIYLRILAVFGAIAPWTSQDMIILIYMGEFLMRNSWIIMALSWLRLLLPLISSCLLVALSCGWAISNNRKGRARVTRNVT